MSGASVWANLSYRQSHDPWPGFGTEPAIDGPPHVGPNGRKPLTLQIAECRVPDAAHERLHLRLRAIHRGLHPLLLTQLRSRRALNRKLEIIPAAGREGQGLCNRY